MEREHEYRPRAAYAGFAVFGGLWGAWGASIPAIRDQAGITDGQLGVALLFVGAGALPAMLLAGRAVDRWGHAATAVLLGLLGAVGVLVAATAQDMLSLAAGLVALGASSGAADVAINTAAGSAERASGRPVIGRAHAAFSTAVVVASLVTGALRELGAPLVAAFALVATAAALAAISLATAAHQRPTRYDVTPPGAPPVERRVPLRVSPLLILGGLGALAFAVENAHQSWSALYLSDALGANPATAATGPAVFAGVVAITRFTASGVASRHPTAVLVAGAAIAAAGSAVVAAANAIPVGLLGLAVAAIGTAVLFPTLLSILTTRTPDHVRGTATSIVTSVSYLGFLAGPVYVGGWAATAGLPGAMLAVAALAAGLALLAGATLRRLAAGAPSWASADGERVRPACATDPASRTATGTPAASRRRS